MSRDWRPVSSSAAISATDRERTVDGSRVGKQLTAGNPFHDFVAGHAALLRIGAAIPAASVGATAPSPEVRAPGEERGPVLLFSPHPDDECIIGALPLRLRREAGMRVLNVAVTLGSDRRRRAARRAELEQACVRLGFETVLPCPDGIEAVRPATRVEDPRAWARAVELIGGVLDAARPSVVLMPHEGDGHPTHVGTALLVRDAVAALGDAASPLLVETEYWVPMPVPNLMIASTVDDVAELVAALSLHIGEVRRNPYHLRLPAWMIDNVRRGTELLAGHNTTVPRFPFATLYRASRVSGGQLVPRAAWIVPEGAGELNCWLEKAFRRRSPDLPGGS